MPAERLRDQQIPLRQFDVGGLDSEEIPEFVRHVGLVLQAYEFVTARSAEVRLVHMGPPITRDESNSASTIQTVGTAQLTVDELLQIGVFVDELAPEREAEEARPSPQYVIRPHAIAPNDKIPFWRFSCSGFTIEAYREAGIQLLEVDEASLPTVSLEMLQRVYADMANLLTSARFRSRYGLDGDGPWGVVLAGYVVNALARDAATVRQTAYTAKAGDEFFPSRAQTGSNEGQCGIQ